MEQMSKYIVDTLKIVVLKWEKREMNVEWRRGRTLWCLELEVLWIDDLKNIYIF